MHGTTQMALKPVAEEDVVSQNEGTAVARDESLANDERLRKPVRRRLDGIGKRNAKLGPVSKKILERGKSSGVDIRRMSRIPAIMSTLSG